jgi:hypothetical protein
MHWFLSFFIGTCPALIEILSRHRGEPVVVIAGSVLAWLYLVYNGIVTLAVHAALINSDAIKTLDIEPVILALFSGLASALLLRARLFWLSSDTKQEHVSFGPGYATEEFLRSVDFQIDRRCALRRVSVVASVMEGKDFAASRILAATMITGCRGELSLQDQKDLANQIREVNDRKIPDQGKAYALGFILRDFMGEDFLRQVAHKFPPALPESAGETDIQPPREFDSSTRAFRPQLWQSSERMVSRAKDVLASLSAVPLESMRRRTLEALSSGELGIDENERRDMRQMIAEILDRPAEDQDKVFALGFAVRSFCDPVSFRIFVGGLLNQTESEQREKRQSEDVLTPIVPHSVRIVVADPEDSDAPAVGRFLSALQNSFSAETAAVLTLSPATYSKEKEQQNAG